MSGLKMSNAAGAAEAGDFPAIVAPLRQLCLQPDRTAVERQYATALNAAEKASDVQALFDLLRIAFSPWRHLVELQRLEYALDRLNEHSVESAILGLRLRVAMRDYAGFLTRYEYARQIDGFAQHQVWSRRFARLAQILTAPKFPDFTAPKVFGIGLSKSGTHSLNAAIESFGLMSMHFNNEFSGMMLGEEDAYIVDAMTDTPVCIMFETLFHRFENAKFVYTTRPYEAWAASFTNHCRKLYRSEDFRLIRRFPYQLAHHTYITDFEKVDCALYFRHRDLHEAYAAYERRVSNFFADKPGDRFLRIELGQGDEWSQLAAFLGQKTPDGPFPWANRSA